jgi:hypothetical protein
LTQTILFVRNKKEMNMSILRDKFVGLAAPVMAATLAFSAPAWAEDNPANSNVPVTNASMSINAAQLPSEACAEWKKQASYPIICGTNMDKDVVQAGSMKVSREGLVLTVWGENTDLMERGRMVTDALSSEGKKVALVFGPDRSGLPPEISRLSAEYELYSYGNGDIQISTSEVGMKHIDGVVPKMTDIARKAYSSNYQQKLALNN